MGARRSLNKRFYLAIGSAALLLLAAMVAVLLAAMRFDEDADRHMALLADLTERADEGPDGLVDRIETAANAAQTSQTWLLRSSAAAVLLGTLLLWSSAVALRRLVIQPIRQLSEDVAEVARGDVGHPIRGERSRELNELAESVSRMRARILSERDHAQRAIDAMDQQAPALAALRTLLEPRQDEAIHGLDVAAALVPADGLLAGDWFDITARTSSVVIALGDVCGHGVDAGLLAVRTKFALLDAIDLGLHPAAAVELASNRFGRTDTFATTVVAEIDAKAGVCRYASAGHTPILLLREGEELAELPRTGPLLGMAQGPRPNASVPVKAGDTLVLFTDGVIEARPSGGEQFLVERLVALVSEHPEAGAAELSQLVLDQVVLHCGGRCPDDATIAVVRVADGVPAEAGRRGTDGGAASGPAGPGRRARQ